MNLPQLKHLLRRRQRQLGLTHWSVEVDLTEELAAGIDACSCPSANYEFARIGFARDWREWSAQKTDEIVLHELLHLIFHDQQRALHRTTELLGLEARELAQSSYDAAAERAIERLALILARDSKP